MKKFNWILTGLLIGLVVWLLFTIANNTIFRAQYDNYIKITTIATGKTTADNNITISKDEFDATMQKVAYTARQEAQNEYDKNFTTLLTILTIFGIAWPVIIALLQFKFNESELDKIKKAQSDANAALQKVDKLSDDNQKTLEITKDAYNETLKRIRILFHTNKITLSSMALGNRDFSDYYYVLALRCAVWSIQAVKELGFPDDALDSIMSNVNLITPQHTTYDLAEHSLEMLKEIKQDLQNNINVSGEKLELLVQIFTLLDEKIAAYEKLLAAANNNNK